MATLGTARLTLKLHVLIPTILSICLLLLTITFLFQNAQIKSAKNSGKKLRNLKKVDGLDEKVVGLKIDPRVLRIPDTRSLYCKQIVYDFNPSEQQQGNLKSLKCVSIILVFSDYQFYEMKKTIESVLVSDGVQMIQEILIVDDATSLDYIIDHSTTYLAKIPGVRLMRTNSNEPLGVAKTRNLAARAAEGEFLVFLDNSVVVTKGWLQPLIHWLLYHRLTVATPHFDLVRDPVSMFYSPLPDNTTFTITLTLSIRPFQVFSPPKKITFNTDHSNNHNDNNHNDHNDYNDHNDDIDYSHTAIYDSPALRGDVLAVEKEFFLQTLGGYEESLQDFGGGESVDLTLKAWLCGRGIKVITCSKVGVVNVLDPVKTRSSFNVKLLVKKWFGGSGFSSSIYRLTSKGKGSEGAEKDSDDSEERSWRKKLLEGATKPQHCHVPIKRYINKVAINLVKLKDDSIAYGLLKAGTNRCAHLIRTESMVKLKMDLCERLILTDPRGRSDFNEDSNSLIYEKETIFQLSRGGQLRVGARDCVTARENAYLSVSKCRDGDEKQKFKYQDGLLVNVWSKFCVMQVTDPDKSLGKDRQIAMIQSCNSYTQSDKDFMTWIFVNL